MDRKLTKRLLRSLMDYDAASGDLTWRIRPRRLFVSKNAWLTWNTRFAGKPALHAKHKMGYYYGGIFSIQYLAHRVIWFWVTGRWPVEVDHDNGDGRDNAWSNLLDRGHKRNMRNRRLASNNRTGVNGVYLHNGKYIAQIEISMCGSRKSINLGKFDKLSDAAQARQLANRKYGFSKRHGQVGG